MNRFFEPDLTADPDSPFVRDASNKLVRRGYWMDMPDKTLVMVMTQGIGANLTNDQKRAHLTDLKREHLIDQVCIQEILPPENNLWVSGDNCRNLWQSCNYDLSSTTLKLTESKLGQN